MAARTTKPKETEEVLEVKEDANEEVSVAELKQMLIQAQQMITQLTQAQASDKVDEAEPEEYENLAIAAEEYITVIAVCSTALNLSTGGNGRGKVFKFKGFGATKRILYSDLVDIMEAHDNFLQDGYFYIADKRVIRKHGLDDLYEGLLDKSMIEKILKGKTQDALELFKSANPKQQSFICDMLIAQVRDNAEEDIDLNLIDAISRMSGVRIYEKAKDAQFYQQTT